MSMGKTVFLCLFLLFLGLFGSIPAAFSDEINALIRQDETFFLQNEIKQLKAEKDLVVGKAFFEKEGIKKDLVAVKEERDLLQKKVDGLQKALFEREQSLPDQMKKMTDPFQEKIDEQTSEIGVLKMAIDEKNRRINELSGEQIVLQAEVDGDRQEKIVLAGELQKAKDELAALQKDFNNRVQKERASSEDKVRDLQARLIAEKALTGEKIKQVQKPWEDKVLSLSRELRAQDAASRKKLFETTSSLESRIKDLEGRLKKAQAVPADKSSVSKVFKVKAHVK